MAEPDVIPTSASIASVGKGVRYVGNWAYAYSGMITTVAATELTLLDFVSGSGFIKCRVQFSTDWHELVDKYLEMQIKLNGEFVYFNVPRGNYQGSQIYGVDLIIPPLTHVEVIVLPQGNTPDTGATMTGRVYGAE